MGPRVRGDDASRRDNADAFRALFTFQTAHLVPAAHVCARGLRLCFTHPESRGGRSAEKRSGARRSTRWTRHNAACQAPSEDPTISMQIGASVPIVSQTEIGPMKTALSLMLAPATDDGARRGAARAEAAGAGRLVPARYIPSGSFCMPSQGAADAITKPPNGSCPWEWIASGSYRLRNGRARPLPSRPLRFLCRGSSPVPRGQPPRRLYLGAPEPGDEQESARPREQPDDVGAKATAAADLPGRLNTVHNSRTS
jgi:hypothetical protein